MLNGISLDFSGVYVCGKYIYMLCICSPSPYRGNNSGLKFVKLRGWISVFLYLQLAEVFVMELKAIVSSGMKL